MCFELSLMCLARRECLLISEGSLTRTSRLLALSPIIVGPQLFLSIELALRNLYSSLSHDNTHFITVTIDDVSNSESFRV